MNNISINNDIFINAKKWHDKGIKTAIATVINTWGSSPRPVGSQLIVNENGQFFGSISGGCIESDVIMAAKDIINHDKPKFIKPKLIKYDISNENAWQIGLTCGGEIEILIEKFDDKAANINNIIKSKIDKISIAIITNITNGEKAAYKNSNNDKSKIDYIAGEEIITNDKESQELIIAAKNALKLNQSVNLKLANKHYFIKIISPIKCMVIIGAVHIAQALSSMALISGFKVIIIDPRSSWATAERFPNIKIIQEWPEDIMDKLDITNKMAIITLSHDKKFDDPALEYAIKSKAFYIGALGSKRTHAKRIKRLDKSGFNKQEINKIDAPIGMDIGAKAPAEIAISIMANITFALNGNIKKW